MKLEHDGYKLLKFVGVGGDTGKEDIWDSSLLYQIKQQNPNGIKLAIAITMYNEGWDEF